MFSRLIFVFILSTALATDVVAAAAPFVIQYSERVTLVESPGGDGLQKLANPRRVSFDALDRRFSIALQANHTLTRLVSGSTVTAFKGSVDGMPGSWVRLTFRDGQPAGIIWDGREYLALEWQAGGASMVYRLDDLMITPGALGCATHGASAAVGSERVSAKTLIDTMPSEAPGATQQIDIGVIADRSFSDDKGAGTDDAVIARMNIVDGIFSEQAGVQLSLRVIESYQGAADPFSDVTVPSDLLTELRDYRNVTPAQNANGLTHLFTGRDLDGSTVGIAYRGALCLQRFGAGLTQATGSSTIDALVAAHEFGHNFGAPHDGETDSLCESEPEDFLMAPRLNGSDQFSACSLAQIAIEVGAASCISPLASNDVEVQSVASSTRVLLGERVDIDFRVNNVGAGDSGDVRFEVDLPQGVVLNDASASVGECVNGAGQVACQLGQFAVGAGADIRLDLNATGVGDALLAARVINAGDSRIDNDAANSTVVISPAVNLNVATGALAALAPNSSATLQLVVENPSTISATDVQVTLDTGVGLRINSAEWTPGTCTVINDNTANCAAATLAAGSSNVLRLNVTGVSEGSIQVRITASSAEPDLDSADNEAAGSLSVSNVTAPPPADDSDGGGGSFGLPALLWLLLLGFVRRGRQA